MTPPDRPYWLFVAAISTYGSLRAAQERFYEAGRFPRIFVTLKRAPLSIVPRLNALPGVVAVEPRIARDVILDWPESTLPVSARMVSLTRAGDETLARLHMRAGTAPEPGNVTGVASLGRAMVGGLAGDRPETSEPAGASAEKAA